MNHELFDGVIVTDGYCSYEHIGFDGDLGYEQKRVALQNTPAETFISAHSPSCLVIENDVPFYAFGAINPDVDGTYSPNRFFVDDQLIGTVQKGGFSTASIKIEPGKHRLFVGTYDNTCGHAVWGFHRNDVLKEPETKKKIGVAVVAVGIEPEIIERFKKNFEGTDVLLELRDDPLEKPFSKSKYLNKAIRRLIEAECDIIVQTDIDMVFGKDIIEFTRNQCRDGFAVWNPCVYADYDKWRLEGLESVFRNGVRNPESFGCWVAMTKKDWNRTGGFDERLVAWGEEDTKLHQDIKNCGIARIILGCPIVHVNHDFRCNNYEIDRKASYDSNHEIIKIPKIKNYLSKEINKIKIGVAVAANNIDEETKKDFISNMQTVLDEGDQIFINDKPTFGIYNLSRNKNIAIHEAIKDGCDIVISTDIDIKATKSLIEKTRTFTRDGFHFFSYCVFGDQVNTNGYGGWNSLTTDDWLKIGGFDERLFGYGREDNVLCERVAKLGIKTTYNDNNYPIHTPHAPRQHLWKTNVNCDNEINKAIGETEPHKNFLKSRFENLPNNSIDNRSWMEVFLFCTSKCLRKCTECTAQEVRKFLGNNFEMTINDVEYFIECVKTQNVKIPRLFVTGGEPLLWKNLHLSLKLFRESGMFEKIAVFTGMLLYDEWEKILPDIDELWVSNYGETPKRISDKVIVQHDQTRFYKRPETSIEGTRPARCNCPSIFIANNRVYVCGNILGLLLRDNKNANTTEYSEPLTSQFFDLRYGIKPWKIEYCDRCVGNLNVRPHVEIVDNTNYL